MPLDATTAFAQAWDRFIAALAAYSPGSPTALRPAAPERELTALEGELGFALHPALRALLARHNGVATGWPDPGPASGFLPLGHRLLSVAEITESHALAVDLGLDLAGEYDADELLGHTDHWVPFARSDDGGMAFVDHHPGPAHGVVWEVGLGSGDFSGDRWAPDLTTLVATLADCLEGPRPLWDTWWPTRQEHAPGHVHLAWNVES